MTKQQMEATIAKLAEQIAALTTAKPSAAPVAAPKGKGKRSKAKPSNGATVEVGKRSWIGGGRNPKVLVTFPEVPVKAVRSKLRSARFWCKADPTTGQRVWFNKVTDENMAIAKAAVAAYKPEPKQA